MAPLQADPKLMQSAGALAADTRSLDQLKREAQRDPKAAVKSAATQFEALFMHMVLKSMRDATPKSGLLGTDTAHDTYSAMLDQQLAAKVATSGTGLADTIARQLTQHMNAQSVNAEVAPRHDRYAELDKPNTMTAVREAELSRRNDAVRAAYLNRTTAPAEPQPVTDEGVSVSQAQRNFVVRHWDSAVAAERATGVPAKFIVSQAALESGWGKQEIKHADGLPSYNLFGIKAGSSWKGQTVDITTTEYENGQPKKVVEKFRAYASYAESFRDWALLMANHPRYAQVLQHGGSSARFAYGLQQTGYATDPHYGEKLTRVINAVSAVSATSAAHATRVS